LTNGALTEMTTKYSFGQQPAFAWPLIRHAARCAGGQFRQSRHLAGGGD